MLLPLLASAYGFSQVNAKTDDGFFLGFPSYWNIVAYYLFVLQPPLWVSVALISICSVLTFVPTPYLYATRGGPFAKSINVGSAVWFVSLGLVLFGPGGVPAASRSSRWRIRRCIWHCRRPSRASRPSGAEA